MATKRQAKPYKLDTTKKIITIFDNITQTVADKADIAMYVAAGYVIKHSTKITVEMMEAAMKDDTKALEEFKKLKGQKEVFNPEKGKMEAGFHAAMKFYNNWKEEQKEAAKGE